MKASANSVNIVISAEDKSSEVVKKATRSLDELKKESKRLSDESLKVSQSIKVAEKSFFGLSETSSSLSRNLYNAAVAAAVFGTAITINSTKAVLSISKLGIVIDKVKSIASNEVAKNYIDQIKSSAEEATKELAPLSDVLRSVTSVSASAGQGIIFNKSSQELGESFFDKAGKSIENFDQNLGKKLKNGKAALAIKTLFQVDPKGITTFSDLGINLAKNLSSQLRDEEFESLAEEISQEFAGVSFKEMSKNLDKQLANTVLDGVFQEALGSGIPKSIAKTLLTAPIVRDVVPNQGFKSLSRGSFTEAFDKASSADISSSISSAVKSGFVKAFLGANNIVATQASGLGEAFASLIFKRTRAQISKETVFATTVIGNSLDGVGEKLAKRIVIPAAKLLPGSSEIERRLLDLFSGNVGGLLQKLLSKNLTPVVASLTKGLADTSQGAIADTVGGFFPAFLSETISSSLKNPKIRENLLSAFNPAGISQSISGLGGSVFGGLRDAGIGAEGLVQKGLQKVKDTLLAIPGILEPIKRFGLKLSNDIFFGIDNIKRIVRELGVNAIQIISSVESSADKLIADAIGGILNFKSAISSSGNSLFAPLISGADFLIGSLLNIGSILPSISSFAKNTVSQISSGVISLGSKIQDGLVKVVGVLNTGILPSLRTVAMKLVGDLIGLMGSLKLRIYDVVDLIQGGIISLTSAISYFSSEAVIALTNVQGYVLSLNPSFKVVSDGIEVLINGLMGFGNASLSAGNSAQGFVEELGNGISWLSGEIENTLLSNFSNISTTIDSLGQNIASTFGASAASVQNFMDELSADGGIFDSFFSGLDALEAGFNAALPSVNNFISSAFSGFNTLSQQIRTTANTSILKFIDIIGDGFDYFIANILPSLKKAFAAVDKFFAGAFTAALSQLGVTAGAAFASSFFGSVFDNFAPGLDLIDQALLSTINKLSTLSQRIAEPIGQIANIPGAVVGFNEPLEVLNLMEGAVGKVSEGIFAMTEKITFFSQGMQALQSFVSTGPFQMLIGQSIELREQLLSTQASLVGTSKIFQNGVQVTDPTKAIQALDQPVSSIINKMRTESLELVGVTSKDLVPLFQILASKMAGVGGGLEDAKDLTLDFAASMGTINLPLGQAQQEISSIINGQIDMNSVLAKNLNITNEQVAQWKAQGKFVEILREKLAAFRAGNKLAAASVNGITSNIQEIFDNIARLAGEKLLDPIIKELTAVYEYLLKNQDSLVAYVGTITDEFLKIGLAASDTIKALFQSLGPILSQAPGYLVRSLSNAVVQLGEGVESTIQVLQPFINILAELFKYVMPLGGGLLKLFLQLKTLEVGIQAAGRASGILSQLLPGVGDGLFFANLRSQGLVNQFVTMSGVVQQGAAGFLLLGQNLEKIPGAMGIVSQALGPVGGILTPYVPMLSGIGIQVVGLIKLFPMLGVALGGLVSISPALVQLAKTGLMGLNVAGVSLMPIFAPLAPMFDSLSGTLGEYANSTDRAKKINDLFKTTLVNVGKSALQQITSWGLLAGAAYVAFLAIDNLILKNEGVKSVLLSIGEGAKIIAQIFLNPWVMGLTAAVGSVVALRIAVLTLNPTLLGMAVQATALVAAFGGVTGNIPVLVGAIAGLSTVVILANTQLKAMIALSLGNFFIDAGEKILGFAKTLGTLKLLGLADSAQGVAKGLKAMGAAMGIVTSASEVAAAATAASAAAQAAQTATATASAAATAAASASATGGFAAFSLNATAVSAAAAAATAEAAAATAAATATATAAAAATGGAFSFTALWKAMLKTALSAATFLAPFIAIGAVLAGIGFIAYTAAAIASGEATEEFGRIATQVAEDNTAALQKLNKAKKAQADSDKSGIALTKEQYAQNKKDIDTAKQRIELTKEEIATLEQAKKDAVGDDKKNVIQAKIDELKKQNEALADAASNISITPQDLTLLGDTITQLKNKADGAWQAILKPNGDPNIFKQRAQEVIDLTQRLTEMGQVSAGDATEKLTALANDSRLDQEIQLKAQEGITKIIETESKKRIDIIQRQQSEVQALQKSGAIGEAEAAKKTSDLKVKELEEQKRAALEKQASAKSFNNVEAARAAGEEVKKIEADLTAALGEELQRRNKERTKDFDEQMSLAKRQKSEGLLDNTEFAEKSAEIDMAKNKEEIRQLEEQLKKISSTDKEGREALNAQINEAYAKQKEIRDKAFQEELADIREDNDERIKIEQRKITKYDDKGAVTNKEEVVQKTAEISQKGIDDEIARIKEQIAKTSSSDKEGKEKLLAQLADAEAKKKELQQKAYQDRLSAIREQGERELKIAEGSITDSRELAKARVDIQVAALDKEIKIATGPELAAALKKRRDVIAQGLQDELSAIKEDFDEKAKLLDADLANGNKTESEYNRESLANQQASLDTQLSALKSALNDIGANDKEGREKINAQIAEIERKKVDIIAEAQKRELDLLKRQQDKALDLVTESENKRLIEIQKLKNSGDISDSGAEEEKIKLTQDRLKKQLQLEKDFLAKMEGQAPLSDPAKEAERQDQIREQRKKTQDITIQLLENEAKAWEAYVNRVVSQINKKNTEELTSLQKKLNKGAIEQEDVALEKAKDSIEVLQERISLEKDKSKIIELQLQLEEAKTNLLDAQAAKLKGDVERANLAVENSLKRQNQELTRQQTLIDFATKALDMRTQLLQSQKNLQDAGANYLTTELDVLAKTERSEFKKKQIAELTAAIKLDAAIKQAEFDKQSLAIEQQKQNFALQREAIANRIAIAEAKLGVKKAEGALKVAQADPRTSDEDLKRLKLELEGAKDMLGLRNQERAAIGQQAALQEQLQASERQAQDLKSRGNIRNAQAEAATNIASPGRRRAAERDLRSQIVEDFGATSVNDLLGRGRASAEQIRRDAGIGSGRPSYSSPEDQLRDTVGDSEYQKSRGSVGEEFNRRYGDGAMPLFPQQSYTPLNLSDIVAPKVNLPASGATTTNNTKGVTVSPTINLNITTDSKKAGQAIEQAIQPNIENIINEAQRQSAKLTR